MKKEVTKSEPNIYVGLDIGTTKIATVVGFRNEDDKIEVLGYGKVESTGVQHGVIYNLNQTTDGIIKSKEIAETRSETEIGSVYVGVAGRHIKSSEYHHAIKRKKDSDEIITQDEVDKMIDALQNALLPVDEKIIAVIPQRYKVDGFETSDPVGHIGSIIEGNFQVVTGNEVEINKIIRCVRDAKLDLEDITLEPLASGLSCLSKEERERGVVLVDIGGGTTDVAIYYKGNPVYTQVIPFGGNSITKDIASVCRITDELAEKLKVNYGTCIEDKSNQNNRISIPQFQGLETMQITEPALAKIIYARVKDYIIKPVKEAVESSSYSSKLMGGVVLTGGGAMLRHLKELFQYELVRPTRIGRPEFGFVNTLQTDLKHPMYSTALGLLKYAVMENEIEQMSCDTTAEPEQDTKKEPKSGDKEKGGSKPFWGNFLKRCKLFFGQLIEATA